MKIPKGVKGVWWKDLIPNIIGITEEEKKGSGVKTIVEKIVVENFLKLIKGISQCDSIISMNLGTNGTHLGT